MKISGLTKCSLCDYPGRIAAVIFTQGCNFRCPFCHNESLLNSQGSPKERLDPNQLLQFLKRRSKQLDGVVVTGGEPTIHHDLPEFLEELKSLNLAVKLDSNGSNPHMLETILNRQVVDFIAMDIKAPLNKYAALTGVTIHQEKISRSIALIAKSGIKHEFRTTVVSPLMQHEDLDQIKDMLPSSANHRWQQFRPAYALDTELATYQGQDLYNAIEQQQRVA